MEYTDLLKEALDGDTSEKSVAKFCEMEKEVMEIYPDIFIRLVQSVQIIN